MPHENESKALPIARAIVEAHINTWGYIPHPDYLKDSIAAALNKAAILGHLHWDRLGETAPVEPQCWKCGAPEGGHCQDGGSIHYCSRHDEQPVKEG